MGERVWLLGWFSLILVADVDSNTHARLLVRRPSRLEEEGGARGNVSLFGSHDGTAHE